ncbi:MAG: hypothetical protein GY769_16840 [bacterium]|nr:hypothetical protein [bacterium]
MGQQNSRFRWPVAFEQRLEAPAEQVWPVISAPGNLEKFHPFCKRNPVEKWPGAESRDAIHYYSGLVLERHFTRWVDSVGYDLELFQERRPRATVTWRLSPVDPHSSLLRITVKPDIPHGWPVAVRWLPHFTFVRPVLKRYLRLALGGLAWHVATGQPVRRNQFGRLWGF